MNFELKSSLGSIRKRTSAWKPVVRPTIGGRYFLQRGHEVYLIAPHIVAKYRTGNKNDANDARAIYEAAQRPESHFVAVRTLEQQDLASWHKLRQGHMKQRTQLANRIRGLEMEYGVKFSKGIS
jgi:transposase